MYRSPMPAGIARRWSGCLPRIDKSVAWFNDTANRTEAVDILVKEMKSPREPVERSYDFLRKINYFCARPTRFRVRACKI